MANSTDRNEDAKSTSSTSPRWAHIRAPRLAIKTRSLEEIIELPDFNCPESPVWTDIKPAFTQGDIDCMKRVSVRWPNGQLDLSDYNSVFQYRDDINKAVNDGSMPANAAERPWAPLACWNKWYENGCPRTLGAS